MFILDSMPKNILHPLSLHHKPIILRRIQLEGEGRPSSSSAAESSEPFGPVKILFDFNYKLRYLQTNASKCHRPYPFLLSSFIPKKVFTSSNFMDFFSGFLLMPAVGCSFVQQQVHSFSSSDVNLFALMVALQFLFPNASWHDKYVQQMALEMGIFCGINTRIFLGYYKNRPHGEIHHKLSPIWSTDLDIFLLYGPNNKRHACRNGRKTTLTILTRCSGIRIDDN